MWGRGDGQSLSHRTKQRKSDPLTLTARLLATVLLRSGPEARSRNQHCRSPDSWCGEEGDKRVTAVASASARIRAPGSQARPPPADRQAQGSTRRTEETLQGGGVGGTVVSLQGPVKCDFASSHFLFKFFLWFHLALRMKVTILPWGWPTTAHGRIWKATCSRRLYCLLQHILCIYLHTVCSHPITAGLSSAAETVWPTQPKIFTLWPLVSRSCMVGHHLRGGHLAQFWGRGRCSHHSLCEWLALESCSVQLAQLYAAVASPYLRRLISCSPSALHHGGTRLRGVSVLD